MQIVTVTVSLLRIQVLYKVLAVTVIRNQDFIPVSLITEPK